MRRLRVALAALLLTAPVAPAGAGPPFDTGDPEPTDARPKTTLGLGGIWHIKGPVSLLGSAGPSFAGRHGDRYHAYLALGLNF